MHTGIDKCRYEPANGVSIFMVVGFGNKDNLLKNQQGKGFIPDKGWMRPSDRETGTGSLRTST
jgi:hypothetical protein